ncbi:hematopoietic SH2 domain-containing protein homolog [Triplophysa rosa]|uniref:Hematopoietic SH2 domain-containing protein-like protein n=1 Tax=Triplophysa rosa TaxID=992332 RepID=A0A9W7W8L1_TRIRA|nr:hematopoietic SH2 domain-containing protein homolog [Triplophysa rosa]XP_057181901.1 hematopoietic SH2 domain-containing protein homolog [Triplophysa rosa]KAI7791266.1 Hematopoietic SH2 domain-containing protein-like protein [Triplophysa rosa]
MAFSWFTESHRSCVLKNGIVPEWFHGIISRKAAEEMLMCKPPGYFLIRVSESRVGYTLSYRGEDRCRHFMIDLLSDNQYEIVGEKHRYSSLHDLVAFHRRTPIAPYCQLLTVACEQADKNSYAELLFPQRKNINVEPNAWMNSSTEHNPSLPIRNESSTQATSPTTGLYPSLETELASVNLQSMELPTKPVPKPRTIHNISTSPDTPPQLPPRDCLPSHPPATVEVDRSQGPTKGCLEKHQNAPITPSEDKGTNRNQQKQSKNAIMGLAQIKRKLKKKHSQCDEHTYEEIFKDACDRSSTFSASNSRHPSENDYLRLIENCPVASLGTSDGIPNIADRKLPIEYLNPPPFAPGF